MSPIRALTMPKWGIEMQEGTLAEWLVQEGQSFEKGQLIALIETDKITNEIEAEAAGVMRRIITPNGSTKPVGALLAIIADSSASDADIDSFAAQFKAADTRMAASAGAAPSPQAKPSVPAAPRSETQGDFSGVSPQARALLLKAGIDPSVIAGSGRKGRITLQDAQQYISLPAAPVLRGALAVDIAAHENFYASPLAKRLAAQHGVDLAKVKASGPRGRIGKADIVALLGPGAMGGRARIEPMNAMRRAIARRLTEAKILIPHYYLRSEVRLEALLARRAADNHTDGVKASLNDYLVRAAALALAQSPAMNIQVHGETIHYFDSVDISVAVASEKGLTTPVVRNAAELSVTRIAETTRRLIDKAKAGRLSALDIEGGAFTISNLGMFGVDGFDAIINPPQGSILAVGGSRRVFAEQTDGRGAFESRMMLTLSCDHRAIDGAVGAQFLKILKGLIEAPESL